MRTTLASLALALTPTFVAADPVVVELFTSQGCSSCPPADAMLHDLAADDDVIALALHVDYWDFIGWPDTFARPEHGARQKAYAKEMGSRMVYTPQVIVGGRASVEGTRPMAVAKEIQAQEAQEAQVQLVVSDGGITAAPVSLDAPVEIHVVDYIPSQTVSIEHGENAGREIAYSHIVSEWTVLGAWDGTEALSAPLPEATEGTDRVAFAQVQGAGPILGALRID